MFFKIPHKKDKGKREFEILKIEFKGKMSHHLI